MRHFCEKRFYFKWLSRRKQGWRKPLDHPWHQVHVLGQVKHANMWAGDLYHQIIAQALTTIRSGHGFDEEATRRMAHGLAEAQFDFSARKEFVVAVKSRAPTCQGLSTYLALFEHAYDLPTDGILADVQQKLDAWLSNTAAWQGWARLVDSVRRAPNVYIEPQYLKYVIGGARVTARMDVGIELRSGDFALYDWKCYRDDARFAEYDQAAFKHQLLAYALWPVVRQDEPLAIDRVTARVFNPASGEEQVVHFTDDDHADFELKVASWARMQELLFPDVGQVEVDDLDGPYDPQRSCPWCPFKGVCGQELSWHTLT